MAHKYEKTKLGLSAYITFALVLVAIVIMIILLVPTKKERLRNQFKGTYTVKAEDNNSEDKEEPYDIGKDHLLTTYSFKKLKKRIKSDSYTYVMYGDTSSDDFKLDVITVNEVAKEKIKEAKAKGEKLKIKIAIINSKDFTDKDNLEYIRLYLREVNSDVKNTDSFPKEDIWVFKGNKMLNCYSKSEYSDCSIKMVAQYHIFDINSK